jgi:hypothetical protein
MPRVRLQRLTGMPAGIRLGAACVTDAHLVSACAAIERILARRHPEHHWIVEVGKDGDERQATAAPAVRDEQTGAVPDDPNPVDGGHDAAAADLPHDDGLNQAA